MTSLLKLDKVSKVYGEGNTEVTALHPISLDVKAGEFIGIVGPSGSGKSTLLSIAGALLSPSKGDIYIREQNITQLSEKEMTDIRLKKIGFIFQFANLVPYLNVKEQLLYIAKLKKESKQESEKRADHLLAAFGLGERKNHYPNQLSGGEKQRVAIARAFMNNPDLILADEPTASLDSKRAREVVEMMKREVKESQKAAIMITHDERMLDVCDRILMLRDGQLIIKKGNPYMYVRVSFFLMDLFRE
ncbi:ABC transporter ATP-binding protein [Bacillus thuringiensis]|nr:ABC transporter ATP-binding protein [Bacillus thuringiensis]